LSTREALEQFITHLQTVNRHLRSKVFDHETSPITRVQWLLLRHLNRSGSCTIGQLATHLDVRASTMSQMIDRLEKSGLVYRENHQPDARVKWVALTDKGASLIRSTEALWIDTLEKSFTGFAEEEQQVLMQLMRKLSEELGKNKAACEK